MMKRSRFLLSTSFILLVATISTLIPPASALSGSQFAAGRIIDDFVFKNANTMSVQDIQNFLNAKVPNCDSWGTQSYSGTSRAAYSRARGYKMPLTCLRDYYENPSNLANNLTVTDGQAAPIPAGARSAAQLIKDVSLEYSINPQVLLVLLQKEQGLTTDDWPWPTQFQKATGYACPDTAPCDTQYYGFYNQITSAAWQFNYYAAHPTSYNFRAGITRTIQWNPNAGCGGSSVALLNQSTASLYNYTPYQPNAAALANLTGTGDSCSSYGNRNFWYYFSTWFGTTYANDTIAAHPNGTLVSDGWRVFLVHDNARSWIASPNIFESHGFNWSKIKPASTGDNNLPWTLAIDNLAPGTLFYSNNTPVYVMDYEGGALKKQPISLTAFNSLGYNWKNVKYLAPGEVPADTSSTTKFDALHPSGSIVASYGEGKVYLIDRGARRWINALAFTTNGYDWGKITSATSADLALPEGAAVDINQGTMLFDGNGIYLVDRDQNNAAIKRPVGPWDCYESRLHYTANDWYVVSPAALPSQSGSTFSC